MEWSGRLRRPLRDARHLLPRAGRHGLRRVWQAWDKFRWGARVVGFWPAVAGGVRLARLRLGRRERAHVRLRSGASISFDVASQLPPALVMFRTLIDPEFPLLSEIAEPDWLVVDVGAAIGQFSVFAAGLPVAEVHAFEPSGANISSLRRNLADNRLGDRVHVHQVALSDRVGEQAFVTQGNSYLSRLDRPVPGAWSSELVAVRTLTDEVARLGLPRISVLKINVAGYEPEVLSGAAALLARGAASILVLLIGERSIPWYERCGEWGYRFFFYSPDQRVLHELEDLALSTLERPPWPARHVIGIHVDALATLDLAAAGISLRAADDRGAFGGQRASTR
ncbi:FkbM family methyltransferase [Nocardioides sp. 503]|uniref:FkbM family methyltransferase n=1 Tax=Nocardioides sp. 503 TaxID=2508326 RepID=UPI00106FD9EB|nr:FkbM family methyltransferase [Nocardioides sp. 503]